MICMPDLPRPAQSVKEFMEQAMADPKERAAIEAELAKMRAEQDAAPPPLNVVAWNDGNGWTAYHLEQTEKQGRTLCLRTVPDATRVQRTRTDDGETCQGCLEVL